MKNNNKLLIYVIIVTYNGIKWVDKCVGKLKNSSIPVTPIVIDNNSPDGTAEYIEKNYPETILIKSKENLGFGKANNIGMKKALELECDYVFLLNQDAWVQKDTIRELVNVAKIETKYAILSPLHLNDSKGIDPRFSANLSEIGCSGFIYDLLNKNLNNCYTIRYANAAAWLLSKNTLKAIGGFDPLFFMYGEDSEYILRVHQKGYKIGMVPSSKIHHSRDNHFYKKMPFKKQVQVAVRRATQISKNVHYSFSANIKGALRFFYFSSIEHLFGFNIKKFIVFIVSFWVWLFKLKQIKKHRKISLQSDFAFLKG